jgi:hypothetical protein
MGPVGIANEQWCFNASSNCRPNKRTDSHTSGNCGTNGNTKTNSYCNSSADCDCCTHCDAKTYCSADSRTDSYASD